MKLSGPKSLVLNDTKPGDLVVTQHGTDTIKGIVLYKNVEKIHVLKLASGHPENLSIVPLLDGTRCLSFGSNWRLNVDYNDETSFSFDDDKVAGRIVFAEEGPHLTVIEVGTYNQTFPSLSVTDWTLKPISMFNTTSASHWSIFLLGDDGEALSEAPFFTHR